MLLVTSILNVIKIFFFRKAGNESAIFGDTFDKSVSLIFIFMYIFSFLVMYVDMNQVEDHEVKIEDDIDEHSVFKSYVKGEENIV